MISANEQMSEQERTHRQLRESLERNLVAIAFREPAMAIDATAGVLASTDFADPELARVYEVLTDLRDADVTIEFEAVASELSRRGIIDQIGRHSLREMLSADCDPDNARFYAEQLADLAYRQRLCDAARNVLACEFEPNVDARMVRERFDSRTEHRIAKDTVCTLSEAMQRALEQHLAASRGEIQLGVHTGYEDLDRATSGLHREALWLIGARTNVGKTAFALSLANRFAGGQQLNTAFFSMEMSEKELAERVWADELSINYSRINHSTLDADDLAKIEQGIPRFSEWPFMIDFSTRQTVRDVKAKSKLYFNGKPDLIIVDTLQRMKPSRRQERRHELQLICNDLKDMAKELQCAVILCTQLNADAENREPDLSHLSEGKQIIEPVDTCLLLHRPDRERNEILVKAEKLRRGPKQEFELLFDGKYQRFTNKDQYVGSIDSSGDFHAWNNE